MIRRRRLRNQNNINYKNEYNRLTGELSQSNIHVQTRHTLEQRRRMIRDAYDDSQTAQDIIFPKYITDAGYIRNQLQRS